jgi:hypothetical protein
VSIQLYYSRGERAEKGVAIVVQKSIVRNVLKKIVYNDRIIANTGGADKYFDDASCTCRHRGMKIMQWKCYMA